jgi:hypothetical protein
MDRVKRLLKPHWCLSGACSFPVLAETEESKLFGAFRVTFVGKLLGTFIVGT